MLTYHIMTESEKEIVASWNYTGDYEIYNMPSYQEQKQKGVAFGDPKKNKNFYSYYDENVLVGFTNILEEEKEVFIGIGVVPDSCGCGYGQEILNIAQDISKTLYPEKTMYLEVRTWNKRAVACYQKAGYVIDGPAFEQETMLGTGHFYRMVHK